MAIIDNNWSHELLQPSLTQQEKSVDVSTISKACLVCELQNHERISRESIRSIVH